MTRSAHRRPPAGLPPFALTLSLALSAALAGIEVEGITEPFEDVILSAAVPGIVKVEAFQEGEQVEVGQSILELDKRLEELEVVQRKTVMERAADDYQATKTLFRSSKAVSKDELDKKEAEYEVATAEYESAVERLERRRIAAPFAGRIVEIFVHRGAASESHQPLVRLADTTRCYFVGHVPGVRAQELKEGQPVAIRVEGTPDPVQGTIHFISPVADPASGLTRVKAVFENRDGRVRPGLAARMVVE